MDILQVQNLKKSFSTQKAVDDISFSLEQGSIFGLLGPNGAGKTTLIRMITGIFFPDEGRILFEGRPFDAQKDVAYIGYMPEERGLYKKMKIGEQAIYLAQLKGLSRLDAARRVKSWFQRLDMDSWWNKKVEDLSKGMGQKLQFVITVLHEPRLIILDEPFSGLDPVNSMLIRDEIYTIARNGSSIIFSTHRMEQVEEICDHIILVNKGKKILDGTVHHIKQQFKEHLFKISLETPMASSFLPGQTPAGQSGFPSFPAFEIIKEETGQDSSLPPNVPANKKELIVRILDGHQPNDVLSHFINQGVNITGFMEILPSLSEIFIRQVEGTSLSRQFLPNLG